MGPTIYDEETFLEFQRILDKCERIVLYPMECIETSRKMYKCYSHGEYWVKSLTLSSTDDLVSINYTKNKDEALSITGHFLKGRILKFGTWML